MSSALGWLARLHPNEPLSMVMVIHQFAHCRMKPDVVTARVHPSCSLGAAPALTAKLRVALIPAHGALPLLMKPAILRPPAPLPPWFGMDCEHRKALRHQHLSADNHLQRLEQMAAGCKRHRVTFLVDSFCLPVALTTNHAAPPVKVAAAAAAPLAVLLRALLVLGKQVEVRFAPGAALQVDAAPLLPLVVLRHLLLDADATAPLSYS